MKMKLLLLIAGMGATLTLHAQEPKTIMDARHECKATIPGKWKTNFIKTNGYLQKKSLVGNSMDAGMASTPLGQQSIAKLKADRMKFYSAAYQSAKLTEDSEQSFQIEAFNYAYGMKGGAVYHAAVIGANLCIVDSTYDTGGAQVSVALEIVKSLAAAK